MGAVTAGAALVSGVVGLARQSSSASAQKEAIRAQSKQQALESQLRLYQLRQQNELNKITDTLNDAITQFNYQQAETALGSQQALNNLAVSNAVFDANVNRRMAEAQGTARDRQIEQEALAQEQQIRQGEINSLQGINQEATQALSAFAQAMQGERGVQSQLANILDMAASTGGVNEALSLLFPNSVQNAGLIENARRQDVADRVSGISQAALSTVAGTRGERLAMSDVQTQKEMQQAIRSEQDALLSGELANRGFESQRIALNAQQTIDNITEPLQRQIRDDTATQQEQALLQGAGLQQELAKAQLKGVQSPGFFDLLNVAGSAYNTYKVNK